MNVREKLRVAQALLNLKVDIIEAGFPISSPIALEAFREVVHLVGSQARVAALARCVERDIHCAANALEGAGAPRIHVFCATSPIHRKHKLRMSTSDVLNLVYRGVAQAKASVGANGDVEFSLEDASRTERDFIAIVTKVAIEAGATTINLPDTVGYSHPMEYAQIFDNLRKDLPQIVRDGIILSAHCHNDLGMAAGNSFAAILAGARQVECTIHGIGERAGNAALETVVMAIKTHGAKYGVYTGVDATQITAASNTLSRTTGLVLARHTPIVGRNAFAHESGIHQDGFIKDPSTYEIMRPEDVGRTASELVLGRHSGRNGLKDRLLKLGISLTDGEFEQLFTAFKGLADQRPEVHDDDVFALVASVTGSPANGASGWTLVSYSIVSEPNLAHSGTVLLADSKGVIHQQLGSGDGPFAALTSAIRLATGVTDVVQDEWTARSVGTGEDALGEAHVTLISGNKEYRGTGADTDSVKASLLAYLQAINLILRANSTVI